jgi:hypothetical protein
MVIIRVLKRKDGASLVVGVALGLLLANLLTVLPQDLAFRISGLETNAGGALGWKSTYLQPILVFLLQVILLEILVWIYVWVVDALKPTKK